MFFQKLFPTFAILLSSPFPCLDMFSRECPMLSWTLLLLQSLEKYSHAQVEICFLENITCFLGLFCCCNPWKNTLMHRLEYVCKRGIWSLSSYYLSINLGFACVNALYATTSTSSWNPFSTKSYISWKQIMSSL